MGTEMIWAHDDIHGFVEIDDDAFFVDDGYCGDGSF